MAKLFLFDIDYTLLYTGGAGGRAQNLAFAQLFGIQDGLTSVNWAGRTDAAIFREAMKLHQLDGDFQALLSRFKEAYHRQLAITLPQAQADRGGRVLPGVRELLEALGRRDDTVLGLATGNFRQGAMMKLAYYNLDYYFRGGAYGDDAEERAQLVALAISHLAQQTTGPVSGVYLIGDTPLDVQAAKANGAFAIAVASGPSNAAELQASAADLVLPDLSGWEALLQRLFTGL